MFPLSSQGGSRRRFPTTPGRTGRSRPTTAPSTVRKRPGTPGTSRQLGTPIAAWDKSAADTAPVTALGDSTATAAECARSRAVVVSHKGRLYAFGGHGGSDDHGNAALRSDICCLDPVSGGWARLSCRGQHPSARIHAAGVVKDGKLVVHGGVDGRGHVLSDLWAVTLRTPEDTQGGAVGVRKWKRVAVRGAPETEPLCRHASCLSASRQAALFHGGHTPKGSVSPLLFEFAFATQAWQVVATQGDAPLLYDHTLAAVGDSVFAFGGSTYRDGDARVVNDHLFLLTASTGVWRRISIAFQSQDAAVDFVGPRYFFTCVRQTRQLWFYGHKTGAHFAQLPEPSSERVLFHPHGAAPRVPSVRNNAGVVPLGRTIWFMFGEEPCGGRTRARRARSRPPLEPLVPEDVALLLDDCGGESHPVSHDVRAYTIDLSDWVVMSEGTPAAFTPKTGRSETHTQRSAGQGASVESTMLTRLLREKHAFDQARREGRSRDVDSCGYEALLDSIIASYLQENSPTPKRPVSKRRRRQERPKREGSPSAPETEDQVARGGGADAARRLQYDSQIRQAPATGRLSPAPPHPSQGVLMSPPAPPQKEGDSAPPNADSTPGEDLHPVHPVQGDRASDAAGKGEGLRLEEPLKEKEEKDEVAAWLESFYQGPDAWVEEWIHQICSDDVTRASTSTPLSPRTNLIGWFGATAPPGHNFEVLRMLVAASVGDDLTRSFSGKRDSTVRQDTVVRIQAVGRGALSRAALGARWKSRAPCLLLAQSETLSQPMPTSTPAASTHRLSASGEKKAVRWKGKYSLRGLNLLFLATQSQMPPSEQQGGVPPSEQQGGVPPSEQQGGVPPSEQQGGDPPTVPPARDSQPAPPPAPTPAPQGAPTPASVTSGNEADTEAGRDEGVHAARARARERANARDKAGREKEEEAATRIQAMQRGIAGRARAKEAKEAEESKRADAKRRENAATTIQTAQRRQSARCIQRETKAQREKEAEEAEMQSKRAEEELAATRIQSIQRGRAGRHRASMQVDEGRARRQEEELAATRIQALQRGRTGRARAKRHSQQQGVRRRQTENCAATKIQAVQRGRQGRKQAAERADDRRKEQRAAAKIQAVHRGKQVRDDQSRRKGSVAALPDTPEDSPEASPQGEGVGDADQEDAKRADAATKIQAVHRGRQARSDQVRRKGSVAALPDTPEEETVQPAQDEAATKIQAIQRGRQARAKAKESQSVRRASAHALPDSPPDKPALPEGDPAQDAAATKIQAIQRGRKARADVKQVRFATPQPPDAEDPGKAAAAVKIQNAQRAKVARREVTQRRKARKQEQEEEKQKQAATKIQSIQRGNAARSDNHRGNTTRR
eukprot:Hpha_TRINITY_DN15416_c1_g1::TRINITY_DN15416_c1_g1_i2::g.176935::m.176935